MSAFLLPDSDAEGAPILLAAAVPFELRPFALRLGIEAPKGTIAHGEHRSRQVSLLAAGMGRPGDALFARAVRDLQPGAIINVGIAGALDDAHPAGSTWIVEQWRAPKAPHDLAAVSDADLSQRLGRTLDDAGISWSRARAVTVDEPLHDPQQRDRIRAGSGADLVEMEGAAWANIAHQLGIPFAAVRTVSDHANRDLPGPKPKGGRRAWLLRDDGRPHKPRLALALFLSGAWLRPRHHISEIKAAGDQFREAAEALDAVADAMLSMT